MKTKPVVYSALLVILSLSVAFMAGEFIVRLLFPVERSKFQVFSSPPFKLDSKGAVRYVKNKIIRTVAVYDGKIEFDVRFHTNNLGFIDDRDYSDEKEVRIDRKLYAFVGDSFTAGIHGGEPWLPIMRDGIRSSGSDIEIYNLGVAGAGAEHFLRILKSASEQITFNNIVILAISNDFERRFWRPLASNKKNYMCAENESDEDCRKKRSIVWIIDYNASEDEIVGMSEHGNSKETVEKENFIQHVKRTMLKHSRLAAMIVRRVKSDSDQIQRDSFQSIRGIREYFPDKEIHLIHLPEITEVTDNRYRIDLREEIEGIGINYIPALEDCAWSEEMFYRNDHHPNQYGYKNIEDCVRSALGL